jgi:hypothetical protein
MSAFDIYNSMLTTLILFAVGIALLLNIHLMISKRCKQKK